MQLVDSDWPANLLAALHFQAQKLEHCHQMVLHISMSPAGNETRVIPVLIYCLFFSDIQWNLSITDILELRIFCHFCCNIVYRDFPLSEVKKCINQTSWDQNFYPYYGGFFYCVHNLGSPSCSVALANRRQGRLVHSLSNKDHSQDFLADRILHLTSLCFAA